MTPDKTLAYDALMILCLLVGFGSLGASFCSELQSSTAETTTEAADPVTPLYACAEEVKALHPQHQAILVHGDARREGVSYNLALWYCRTLTPKGAAEAIHALQPLTVEEVATW